LIAIIDYGMGNLRSVQKGFEKAGWTARITADPAEASRAAGLVLPGVGAFADAMAELKRSGFDQVIREAAAAGKPILGICLGMQLLFASSEENGIFPGLDLLPGRIARFRLPEGWKVPHMGWNQIQPQTDSPLLQGVAGGSYFYFVHSYYLLPEDLSVVLAVSDYGVRFPAVAGRGKVFGIQFHPEKSSDQGLMILKNFGELVAAC